MKRYLIAAALAFALTAGPAAAKDIPSGGLTVEEVGAWLRDNGYKSEMKTLDDGEPYVSSAAEGVSFQVYMYDCKASRCASVQFATSFDLDEPMAPARANEWNMNNRYAKLHLDSENDPFLQYDANVSPGGTWEALDDDFAVWQMMLKDFLDFIDW